MTSTRETILAALLARLQTLAAPVLRGDVLPERIPATGLIIPRDGKPGEPEVTLSPLTYIGTATALTIVYDTLGRTGNTFSLAASITPASNGTVASGWRREHRRHHQHQRCPELPAIACPGGKRYRPCG